MDAFTYWHAYFDAVFLKTEPTLANSFLRQYTLSNTDWISDKLLLKHGRVAIYFLKLLNYCRFLKILSKVITGYNANVRKEKRKW